MMEEKSNRKSTSLLLDSEISRREFGRRAALAAVAAAMCNKAYSEIPHNRIKLDSKCKTFLELLEPTFRTGSTTVSPTTSIDELLYGDVTELLGKLGNSPSTKPEHGPIKSEARRVKLTAKNESKGFDPPVSLHHLYCCDSRELPVDNANGSWNDKGWANLYRSVTNKLPDHIAVPFYYLPPQYDSDQRRWIKELLTSPSYDFRNRVGGYMYLDLFTKSRERLFALSNPAALPHPNDPGKTLSQQDRQINYGLIRSAFEIGVFNVPPSGVPRKKVDPKDGNKPSTLIAIPNDTCWSQTFETCINSPGKYCEEDDDGFPTSSSSICP